MSQYTLTLKQLIENNIKIFDFDYAFYNEEHKKQFEEKFINRFLFEEICIIPVARWKHELKTKLNEIAPYYEHLYSTTIWDYDPSLNYDVREESTRELTSDDKQVLSSNSNSSTSSSGSNKDFDTPVQSLGDYRKTPSFISEGENSSTGTMKNNSTNDKTGKEKETNVRTMQGNIGVMATQDLIMKERNVIINIHKMILDELEILFMGVY